MKPRILRSVLIPVALGLIIAPFPAARAADESQAISRSQTHGRDARALARLQSPPLGLPAVRVPKDNPATIEKIALGRKLFFDRRLSLNSTMSCAMCHIPEQGFTNNELSTPVGVAGASLRRNAPTILNAAYAGHLFRDGREAFLESQAVAPLLARDEMANPSAEWLLAKVAALADYERMFEEAFGGGPSLERIGKAIAGWERTLLAADSPFDRWRYGGQRDALNARQQQGFEIFSDRGRCAQCHSLAAGYALFTDEAFHNTGIGYLRELRESQEQSPVVVEIAQEVFVPLAREVVAQVGEPRPSDWGRFEVTGEPADKWLFKTPSLRNVAITAPYMHDGSLPALEAVVRYYNRGGACHAGLDPLVEPLGLSDSDIAAVVAFLHSLTAGNLGELAADARSAGVGN